MERFPSVTPLQDIYISVGEDMLRNMMLRNQQTGETVTVDQTIDIFGEFDLTSGVS
jgi:hypothetical protein